MMLLIINQNYSKIDGGTGHFALPDLPEHTTTRGASDPNIRNLVPRFYSTVQLITFDQKRLIVFLKNENKFQNSEQYEISE